MSCRTRAKAVTDSRDPRTPGGRAGEGRGGGGGGVPAPILLSDPGSKERRKGGRMEGQGEGTDAKDSPSPPLSTPTPSSPPCEGQRAVKRLNHGG